MKATPRIVTLSEPIRAVGMSTRTSMSTVQKDVTEILKSYMAYKESNGIPYQKTPWEYVSLSINFKEDQTWDYMTGHVVTNADHIPKDLILFEVPAGTYAVFPIKPKLKFLLGLAIGMKKRYIYSKWIPSSEYDFNNYEFEYNDETMFLKNPNHIDLYVGITKKKGN